MKIEFMQMLEKLTASYNINLTVMTPPFEGIENFDYGLRKALDPQFDWQDFGRLLFQQVSPKTLVFAQGVFELHFAFSSCRTSPTPCFVWAPGPAAPSRPRRWNGVKKIWTLPPTRSSGSITTRCGWWTTIS